MAFRQLTDSQCGQSNPLVQMSSLVSKDHTFVDRMGMATSVSKENDSMPPQSFKMTDLISEINKLESQQDSYIAMNPSFTDTTKANLFNPSFASSSRQQSSQSTYFYNQVPQAMYLPPQVRPNEITGGLLESESDFMESPTYDKSKYIVIKSLADLTHAQENVEEPPQVQPSEAPKPIIHQNKLNERDNRRKEAFGRLLNKGKESLANGDTAGAIGYFELALKVNRNSAEAWKLLGIASAENAENFKAFHALNRALSLEPHNLEILMTLAEFYANEGNITEAVPTLFAWLANHPAYKDIIPSNFELRSAPSCNHRYELLHDKKCFNCSNVEMVQNMFCEAARRRPINIDSEVQIALGLLLYVYRDYDKAQDCFRAALQVRPRDSRLWNRLGVILSNLGRHEEALNAHYRAINLDQGSVRSRYNCAMTLMDLALFKGAAKHLLIIVNQLANRWNNVDCSNTDIRFNLAWLNLGLCFTYMGRIDLEKALKNKDFETLNKEFQL